MESAEGLTRPVELVEGPLQGSLTALTLIYADQDVSRRAPLPAIHWSKQDLRLLAVHWLLRKDRGPSASQVKHKSEIGSLFVAGSSWVNGFICLSWSHFLGLGLISDSVIGRR